MKISNTSEEMSVQIFDNLETTDKRCSRLRIFLMKFWKYCEAYGALFAYYGSAMGGCLAAVVVTFINDFEGGCKFPYLSEVARGGLGWLTFFVGTTVGCIPWIIFSFNYFKVFKLLALSIDDRSERKRYLMWQSVVFVFNILSAVGMNGVAFFDMGNFPLIHMLCVILFAIPLNILFLVNYRDMIRYAKETDKVYLVFKLVLLVASFGGILLFTLLGRIEHCKSVVVTLEDCLKLTSENLCFNYLDADNNAWTTLRNYPTCLTMHYWRGLAEYIAVLASAEYIHCLFYDRNTVQLLLFKQFGILSSNSHILKEVGKMSEEMMNKLTPRTRNEMQI